MRGARGTVPVAQVDEWPAEVAPAPAPESAPDEDARTAALGELAAEAQAMGLYDPPAAAVVTDEPGSVTEASPTATSPATAAPPTDPTCTPAADLHPPAPADPTPVAAPPLLPSDPSPPLPPEPSRLWDVREILRALQPPDRLISTHFALSEFHSHDGSAYPEEWVGERLGLLCASLEVLRTELGDRPITIVSGYRSPAWNRRVGGAAMSRHLFGDAVDIAVDRLDPGEVYRVALALHQAGRVRWGGIGVYPGWVHLDLRPAPADGHLARWVGAGVGSEVA